MKILEVGELLPILDENLKDVDTWSENFMRLMKLANITEPSSIHSWAMECVEGKLRGTLQDLVTLDNHGVEQYPSIDEMKAALEVSLEVTPQIKCKRLQQLRILKDESIKNFNWRYKKLYSRLPEAYQDFVTVDDYVESIKFRPYARAQVITQQCETLEEAFEEAELAERAESSSNSRIKNDTVMATIYNQSTYSPFKKQQHPFRLFGSKYPMNNNNWNNNRSSLNNRSSQQEYRNVKKDVNSYPKRNIICYRCNKIGHLVKDCPYSYKELARMEEEGTLNQPLNY